jgi:hypothetical protein
MARVHERQPFAQLEQDPLRVDLSLNANQARFCRLHHRSKRAAPTPCCLALTCKRGTAGVRRQGPHGGFGSANAVFLGNPISRVRRQAPSERIPFNRMPRLRTDLRILIPAMESRHLDATRSPLKKPRRCRPAPRIRAAKWHRQRRDTAHADGRIAAHGRMVGVRETAPRVDRSKARACRWKREPAAASERLQQLRQEGSYAQCGPGRSS